MPRGGARPGSGPKKKAKIAMPLLKKGMAAKLYDDPSTEERWRELRNVGGENPSIQALRLRFDVERYIWDRLEGRPVQQIRVGNPKDEIFKTEVDVTSARDKLMAYFCGEDDKAGPAPKPNERSLAEACREQIRTGASLSEEEVERVRGLQADDTRDP